MAEHPDIKRRVRVERTMRVVLWSAVEAYTHDDGTQMTDEEICNFERDKVAEEGGDGLVVQEIYENAWNSDPWPELTCKVSIEETVDLREH